MVGLRAHRAVLVIEDNNDIREVMKVLLQLEGYLVVTAHNGEDALTTLRGGLRPCLIILDLMMPEMDGFKFRRQQLEDSKLADIPVIVCSGDGNVAEKSKELGVAGYYHKPIEVEEFLGLVSRHC